MRTESHKPTVTFNNPNVYMSADEFEEEDVYVNADVCTVDKTAATPNKKIPSFIRSLSPVAVCWGILLVIMALRIHYTSVLSAKLSDQMIISETTDQCLNYVLNLSLTNAVLKRNNRNLEVQNDEMAQLHTALEKNITNLREENQQVKEENQQVKAENQQVKEENLRLTAENKRLKADYKLLVGGQNVTQIPWSVSQ